MRKSIPKLKLTPCRLDSLKGGCLANSEDSDQMPQNANDLDFQCLQKV